MVVKLSKYMVMLEFMFESGVILYGSKTYRKLRHRGYTFESGVILYGSKTNNDNIDCGLMFESGVILYGSKTKFA